MIDHIFFYRIRVIVLTLAISTLYIQCGCQNPTVGDLEKHKKDKEFRVKALELRIKLAIVNKDTKSLKKLIAQAAELPPSTDNNPYLVLAARANNLAGVQLLLQKLKIEDINAQDAQGYTALHWAEKQEATAIVQALLNTGKMKDDVNKKTPLIVAAERGNLEIVKRLISHNPDAINAQDAQGYTALHRAIQQGKTKIVQALLDTGKANINIKGAVNKKTPLITASGRGDLEIVKKLISHNPDDINAQDAQGYTALHRAVQQSKTAIVQALLDTGKANINTKGGLYKETSLITASEKGDLEIVQSLIKHNPDPTHLNATDYANNTALMVAVVNNKLAVVQFLLQQGADPNLQNFEGTTPLIKASENGNLEIVKSLLNSKSDTSIKNSEGKTALQIATEKATKKPYTEDPDKKMQKIKKALEKASKA